jgi:Protein of unknown function (DUF3108)
LNTICIETPSASAVKTMTAGFAPHRPQRGLVVALVASVALHLAFSFWPAEVATTPDAVPLQATITEMPPPPKPAPAPPAKPRPKPRRATAPPPAPAPAPLPEPAAAATPEIPVTEPTPEALATGPEPSTEIVAAEPATATPATPPKTLPRRVDLVYKAFLGTHGFVIGEAVYRFEHAANEYRITTLGEAKGLAALFIRGQGKVESRGLITATGLQPHELTVERGSRERRETAVFDWEIGIITLHEQKTEVLDLPTFDPLSLMWQAYFTPPVDDTQTVSVATTRRMGRYTLTREGEEKITWPQGEIATERWHRRSEDGKTDAYIWLAPTLHYVPVKMRVTATNRGTLEALLDSIRVDETPEPQ